MKRTARHFPLGTSLLKLGTFLLLFPALALFAQRNAPEPAAATLTVNSTPDGAAIFLDREPVGVTPATLSTTPGTHLVTLKKPGYSDLVETVKILPNTPNILDRRLEQLLTWVLLHSEPMGAEVRDTDENKTFLGNTPVAIRIAAPSFRSLHFALAGHQSKTIQLEVRDQTPLLENVTLLSDTGTLKLTSSPAGARILVNGLQRGVTAAAPVTLDRLDAEVKLELLLDGYQPVTQTIRIAAGMVETLDIQLQPEPATLIVASVPNAARIYLNDAFQGEAPVEIKNLPPGTYRVRAEKTGHDPDARNVELGNAQRRNIEFRLASNQGRLEITTEPAGVAVFIDGRRVAETKEPPDKANVISMPCAIEDVQTGARELRLVKQGFGELRETITVKRGETFTKHFTLKRLFIPDYEIKIATGVRRGVFIRKTAEGTTIETAPGIIYTALKADIISEGFIRDGAQ